MAWVLADGEESLSGGYGAAEIRSASLVCEPDNAIGKSPSLRPFVPGLEVAEVLQAVWLASEHRDVGQANDWKPQCGYSQRTPKLRKSITEKTARDRSRSKWVRYYVR